MLKTLGAQIKEFKKDSVLTPGFMILEVRMHFPVCRNDGWKIWGPRFRRICAQLTKSNV